MMRLLLEHCQADCVPGFTAAGDLPSLAWDFHQDLSFVFLIYSPRNVSKYAAEHPHYQEAFDIMKTNNMVHQFCTRCDDVQCLVNSTMLRIIYICMFYLDAVSFKSILWTVLFNLFFSCPCMMVIWSLFLSFLVLPSSQSSFHAIVFLFFKSRILVLTLLPNLVRSLELPF